jgi:hypothetical protein
MNGVSVLLLCTGAEAKGCCEKGDAGVHKEGTIDMHDSVLMKENLYGAVIM